MILSVYFMRLFIAWALKLYFMRIAVQRVFVETLLFMNLYLALAMQSRAFMRVSCFHTSHMVTHIYLHMYIFCVKDLTKTYSSRRINEPETCITKLEYIISFDDQHYHVRLN